MLWRRFESMRGIPRSHRSARSRPLTLCEGGVPIAPIRGASTLPPRARTMSFRARTLSFRAKRGIYPLARFGVIVLRGVDGVGVDFAF